MKHFDYPEYWRTVARLLRERAADEGEAILARIQAARLAEERAEELERKDDRKYS